MKLSSRHHHDAVTEKQDGLTKHSWWARSLVTLTWLFLWPLLIGVVAVGIGILIAAVFSGVIFKEEGLNTGIAMRGAMATFVVILTVFCWNIYHRQLRSHNQLTRIAGVVLAGYTVTGCIVGLLLVVVIPDPAQNQAGSNAGIATETAGTVMMPTLNQDSQLMSLMSEIGATDTGRLGLAYVPSYDDPTFPRKEGEYQSYINPTTGQFLYGTLTIKQGLDANSQKSTLAHEYLHHIWYSVLDESTKENLTSHLITMYGRDPMGRDRVSAYSDAGRLYPTELFSIYCTESTDQYLTAFVIEQCSKYINRDSFLMLR